VKFLKCEIRRQTVIKEESYFTDGNSEDLITNYIFLINIIDFFRVGLLLKRGLYIKDLKNSSLPIILIVIQRKCKRK